MVAAALKPKVVIDARFFGELPISMGRYVQGIARGLAQIRAHGELPYRPVFLVNPGVSPSVVSGLDVFEVRAPFLHPSEWLAIPAALKALRADLYHSTSLSSLPFCPCPWIANPHDLNHLHYGGVAHRAYYAVLMKRFIRQARAVVTVSEFSRQEISAWSGVEASRIVVVDQEVSPRFLERVPFEERLLELGLRRGGYFLCVSNPKPHKNVAVLVEAYRLFQRPDLPLVLNFEGYESVPGVRVVKPMSDEKYQALLQGCSALFFPSQYEGLGRLPLEGAMAGAPVVLSRIPPHREALGPYSEAHWVEPADLRGWIEALTLAASGGIVALPEPSRQAISRRFSAESLGMNLDRLYRSVLGVKG